MLNEGIKGHQELIVSKLNTANTIKSGTLDVFSTSAMIALMEETAWKSVSDYLDQGSTTVGTLLKVEHHAPSPIGMKIYCDSILTKVDGRKLIFKCEVFDSVGKIGECYHERFVVNEEKFVQKANSRKN